MPDTLDDLNQKFDDKLAAVPVPQGIKDYVNAVQDAAFAKYKAQGALTRALIVFLVAFASVLVGKYVWKDAAPAPVIIPFEVKAVATADVPPGTEPALTIRERIVVRQLRAAAEAQARDAGWSAAEVAEGSAKVTDYQIVLALKASGKYQQVVEALADRPVIAFFLAVVKFIAEHPELVKLLLLLFAI